jgi:hypothetical protein
MIIHSMKECIMNACFHILNTRLSQDVMNCQLVPKLKAMVVNSSKKKSGVL